MYYYEQLCQKPWNISQDQMRSFSVCVSHFDLCCAAWRPKNTLNLGNSCMEEAPTSIQRKLCFIVKTVGDFRQTKATRIRKTSFIRHTHMFARERFPVNDVKLCKQLRVVIQQAFRSLKADLFSAW